MADLHLTDKPIHDAVFGNNISQFPSDIRVMYKALKMLSDGEGAMQALIVVDKLVGRT